ncbi:hypothetical protein HDU82_008582 [Entophlyctis luteolus]|nr:hypothetical protein HDU82_008582 [Entophlyctis luteolus]
MDQSIKKKLNVPTGRSFTALDVLHALAMLKNELFVAPGYYKKPDDYLVQLSDILSTLDHLAPIDEQLRCLICAESQVIQSKCLVDYECLVKLEGKAVEYTNKSTVPGTLLDSAESRKKAAKVPLYQWLIENKDHPYPDELEKLSLAQKCGMTVNQVNHD